MNRYAFVTTGLAIGTLASIFKARLTIHGQENLPDGSIIFVVNHFTRIETLFLPYHIYHLIHLPVWSLADYSLFKGAFARFLENVGAVSTRDPDRDLLIVKSLLTGEANWIIFPEGRMVKNKKLMENGDFMITSAEGKHPPHTGAATLALRTEFYRRRLRQMHDIRPGEAERIRDLFRIESVAPVLERETFIVPVNITYYPIRVKENALSNLARRLREDLPERLLEELMAEGTMLLKGVDADIRFGKPIRIRDYLDDPLIKKDMAATQEINFDDPIPSRSVMRKMALSVMRRYMTAIYRLTTINHDHLFAAMLSRIPTRVTREDDLRARVFLATQTLAEEHVYRHQSLNEDQTHLLTDDRYGKFRDFLELCLEKGTVSRGEGRLVKNAADIPSPLDFHRVRIDNPVWVIANEVEPLVSLQRHIRWIAWQPRFYLRRRVAKYLLDAAYREFEADYQAFFLPEESKPKSVGAPFLLKGRSRKIGVLLLHGYMAAPMEIRDLALDLNRRGYWVYAPRLKGHGTSPEDLAGRSFTDWIDSVDKGYAVVRHTCRKVVVGGFSTGAALALDLAARIDDLAGVFAVSPPMRLQDLSAKLVPAVDTWNRLMTRMNLMGAKKEFVENTPENPHINYRRNPVAGVRELARLMDNLADRLAHIHCPSLVIQSGQDPVVNPKGAWKIFDKLGAENKKYVVFNFKRHGILIGDGAQEVYQTIADFLRSLAP